MAMNNLANQIQLITKFDTRAWDDVYKAQSRASLLTGAAGMVKFSVDNARVVKVAKLSLGGLTDYNRNNISLGQPEGFADRGYQEAAASLVWETKELTMDRAAKYIVDNMDDEETAGLAVKAVFAEVGRTVIIPEVDAYCFSKIASEIQRLNQGNYVSGAINTSAPLAAMNAGFLWLDSHEVEAGNQIAFVSTSYLNNLRSTPELYRRLDAEGAVEKKVSFKIISYEGRDLVMVPPDRFSTGFAKRPHGGYYFTGSPIDFIVMDKKAAVHVVKYQKTKILTGEAALANTDQDATVLFAHIYHDVFVFDNKAQGIYVHVGGYDSLVKNGFILTIDGNGLVNTILEQPAGVLTRIYLTTRDTLPSVGDAWTTAEATDTAVIEGTGFTATGTYHLVGVQGGQVVAVKDLVITGTAGAFVGTLSDHA